MRHGTHFHRRLASLAHVRLLRGTQPRDRELRDALPTEREQHQRAAATARQDSEPALPHTHLHTHTAIPSLTHAAQCANSHEGCEIGEATVRGEQSGGREAGADGGGEAGGEGGAGGEGILSEVVRHQRALENGNRRPGSSCGR